MMMKLFIEKVDQFRVFKWFLEAVELVKWELGRKERERLNRLSNDTLKALRMMEGRNEEDKNLIVDNLLYRHEMKRYN